MQMLRFLASVISFLIAFASFVAQISGDASTTELLAKARVALGGESKLAKVQGLAASGALSRAVNESQITGEVTLELQLPDKMLRTDSMSPMGDATIVTETGINGDTLLRHSRTIGGGPNMIIRMPGPPAHGSDAEAQALRNARAELARLSLALLLAPPPSMPLEFAYGGEAEAEDGKADIVDVKGPSSFAARLFLDKTSHRPLMLVYKGVAQGMVMRTQTSEGPPDPARIERLKRDAVPQAPLPLVDINMFFDDYKAIDGVWLPHHITRSVDGKPTEEWTFKTIKLNPAFKPDTFSAK
ncbi:MAG: hypothetical protein DMF91_19330 [Acidobacteria bacterium]|nr:MAG: hypothetical protein DMF91_19330 [Acidobacteriota bacterium]